MSEPIREVINVYFESMYESSPEKVHRAFHPAAKIVGYLNGELAEMTVAQFADFVASIDPSPAASGADKLLEIISIEIAGQTAVARVRDAYIGSLFLDTLSLVEQNGEWRIYNKLFHIEQTL